MPKQIEIANPIKNQHPDSALYIGTKVHESFMSRFDLNEKYENDLRELIDYAESFGDDNPYGWQHRAPNSGLLQSVIMLNMPNMGEIPKPKMIAAQARMDLWNLQYERRIAKPKKYLEDDKANRTTDAVSTGTRLGAIACLLMAALITTFLLAVSGSN